MGTMMGAFGLFGTLFLLFCRYLPMVAIAEIKATMPQADPHWKGYGHHHGAGAAHAAHSPDAPHAP
jgi:molybdopterin-containing oxidoreductase family membrane subunit